MTAALHFLALLLGFGLDALLGDPHWAPHPVKAIGALIAALEKPLRGVFPKTPNGEKAAGAVLVGLVLGLSTGVTIGVLLFCAHIHTLLWFAVETLLCYQLLAARSLTKESGRVLAALNRGSLEEARTAVSMIVGRDTQRLDESGVAKAAVETVAENASDGVIAPLLFLAIGGAPLGMLYKAANTMDSMVGYQNERYCFYGRAAAKLDDVLNFIPARLAGILMCLAAPLAGLDGARAFSVFRRDRKNHKSPNSAHTEAACAGALGVRLAGGSYYFGQWVDKPTIGDDVRPVEAGDISRANRLMYVTALLALLLLDVLPLLLIQFISKGA